MAIRGLLDTPLTDRAMAGGITGHGDGVRRRGRAGRRGRRGSGRREQLIGSVVAGHRITRLVGRGGMGVVYEAVEEALGRTVALEAGRARAGRRARVPRALHRRVAAGGGDRSPERPAGLQGGRGGRAAVPGDAVRRRRRPALALAAGPDARGARRRPGRRGARRRARAPPGPPRRQARQRPDRARRPRVPDRLRARQGARRDHRPHAHGQPRRHARLRRARADPRRGRRAGGRSVLARLRPVLHAHRRGPVPARRHRAQALGAPLRAAAEAGRPVRRA